MVTRQKHFSLVKINVLPYVVWHIFCFAIYYFTKPVNWVVPLVEIHVNVYVLPIWIGILNLGENIRNNNRFFLPKIVIMLIMVLLGELLQHLLYDLRHGGFDFPDAETQCALLAFGKLAVYFVLILGVFLWIINWLILKSDGRNKRKGSNF